MDAGLFERSLLYPPKLSTVLRELHPQAADFFKNIYSLEFLSLPAEHDEADLHRSLLRNLGRFITELGRDFCFIGSEHPLQVGGQDFALDLLFFHRGLNCLIAVELKVRAFRPEDLGKLNFYLEALDRDHRKTHENPSIGLLLCATKDEEVVEYALSRTLSPTLIAEYQTMLPDKALLRAKLHEFYQLCTPPADIATLTWLTQKMMGLLYGVETHTINYHLKKIFTDRELEENSVIRNFRITAADGKSYDTLHYNLSAYLDLAEDMALRQIPMTMQDWETRLNRFIAATDREVLQDAGKVTAEIAQAHAEAEFEKYRGLQDRAFESDFDQMIKQLPNPEDLP